MSFDSPQPFTQHLDELRRRLIICFGAIVLFSLPAYYFVDPIINWLAKPIGQFVFTTPTEALFVRLKLALSMGVIFSFPVFTYHLWRFIEIALHARERSLIVAVVPIACVLFVGGILIALFIVAPLSVKLLLQFSTPTLRPMISIQSYLSFLFWMVIGFGLLFQLPLIILMLCQSGVVSADTLKTYRKHVLIILLILAAFLTPGPDVVSQVILAVPAYFLFEIALWIAGGIARKKM